jgi:hypothetical protein
MVIGTAGGGRGVGIARGRRRSRSWCVRRVRRDVQITVLPSLSIVLCPLCVVAQNLVRSLDLLELDNELGLMPGIAVGMILQSKSSESFADLAFGGIRGDFEICIVVSCRISFDHSGG